MGLFDFFKLPEIKTIPDNSAEFELLTVLMLNVDAHKESINNTLDPKKFTDKLQLINHTMKVAYPLARILTNNRDINNVTMLDFYLTKQEELNKEEESFIKRYHASKPTLEGKENLSKYLPFFRQETLKLVEELYKA